MANEYDRIVEEMMNKCGVLRAGQTREECCKEKGIANCPPLTREAQPSVYPIFLLGVSFSIVCAFLYVGIRRKWPQRAWGGLGEKTKAILSGWVVWIVIVFSYVLIMEPYGYTMDPDDRANFVMWLTLPPLSALAIYLWAKRFILARR